MRTKIIEIGVWNMNTTQIVNVTHGLDLAKIRRVTSIIVNDAGTAKYSFDVNVTGSMGIITAGAADIELNNVTGSFFDASASFSGTAANRGHVLIEYID
jgi:hypothetical protein